MLLTNQVTYLRIFMNEVAAIFSGTAHIINIYTIEVLMANSDITGYDSS